MEGSSVLHRTNTAQWRDATLLGSTATLADEDALGKPYSEVSFTDIMMRTIGDDEQLKSGLVAWRHPTVYTNVKSVVNACTQVNDGTLLTGSFTDVACSTQNTRVNGGNTNSYITSGTCSSRMNMCTSQTPTYGFFLAEGSSTNNGNAAGCTVGRDAYGMAIVGGGIASNDGDLCVSSWGVGSGYGGTSTSSDSGYGINYHWWGAGNWRLGHDVPIRTVGLFVR